MNRLGNVLFKLNSASKSLPAQYFPLTRRQVNSRFHSCRLKLKPATRYPPEFRFPARHILGANYDFTRFLSDKKVAESKAKDQFENIVTIPNILTVSRMAMCPVLGYLVVQNNYTTAFGLFVAAGVTDLVISFTYVKWWKHLPKKFYSLTDGLRESFPASHLWLAAFWTQWPTSYSLELFS